MVRKSEVIVFVSVVISLLLGGVLVLRQNQEVKRLLTGPPKGISVGDRLDALHGYNWSSHEATLVIALRSGCPFCRASMGFYGRLGERWKGGHLRAYPLVLFPDGNVETRPELQGLRLLREIDYLNVGILSTPTVLVVDSGGKVLRKWTGQLESSQEEAVLADASERMTSPIMR